MPLPKTATIAARATEVYAEVWSVVLQTCWGLPPLRPDDLSDLSRLLPYLRQLLTCCACAGLLADAMVSLSCGHCYCHACQFCTPLLKIQCRQCRERTGLVEERQLRLVVESYKHTCCILADHRRQHPPTSLEPSGDDSSFDPIGEILAEVERGEKVTRSVLIVRPPEKYLKPVSSPRKDPGSKSSSLPSAHTPSGSNVDHSQSSETTQTGDESDDVSHSRRPTLTPSSKSHQKTKRQEDGGRSHKKGSGGSRKRSRQERRLALQQTAVTVQPGAGSSEEEVDVLSVCSATNEPATLQVSTTPPLLRVAELEVKRGCFRSDFVCVSASVLQVREKEPPATAQVTPSPLCTSPGGTSAQTCRQSWSPFCPRLTHAAWKELSSGSLCCQQPGMPLLVPYCDFPPPKKKSKSKSSLSKSSKPAGEKSVKSGMPVKSQEQMEQLKDSSMWEGSVQSHSDGTADDSPTATGSPKPKKAKQKLSFEERPLRCRCGTNFPQFLDNICARNKCPCYSQGMSCLRCLCRHCHNPFND